MKIPNDELIEFIAEKIGCDKEFATEVLETVKQGISADLKEKGEVTLPGLGTFSSKYKARTKEGAHD